MTSSPHRPDTPSDEPNKKHLFIGISFMIVLAIVVPSFYLLWRFVPGILGEWLGVIAGIMSTPFLLEGFFIIMGLIAVVSLNHMRQKREGDEFVFLEQVDDPEAPADIPERSRYAIYRQRPLPGEQPGAPDQIEGALELGDYEAAAHLLSELSDEELAQPAVLQSRLRLARETGKHDVAQRIEGLLNSTAS